MKIGNTEFLENQTYVMGILNVTPDSFSDGGKYNTVDNALFAVEKMIKDGASLIDIGGESTRPGYTLISDDEEISRVLPVIEEVKRRFLIPISLDTYKSNVARAGINAGVDLINDIWGLQYDKKMGELIASTGVSYCLMHNRKQSNTPYTKQALFDEFVEDLNRAHSAGIDDSKIIFDPGIGFAKSQEDNLLALATMKELSSLNVPFLLGCSRKSVINYVLDIPVNERLAATLATTALAIDANALFVRVHDVKENAEFIKMYQKVKKYE